MGSHHWVHQWPCPRYAHPAGRCLRSTLRASCDPRRRRPPRSRTSSTHAWTRCATLRDVTPPRRAASEDRCKGQRPVEQAWHARRCTRSSATTGSARHRGSATSTSARSWRTSCSSAPHSVDASPLSSLRHCRRLRVRSRARSAPRGRAAQVGPCPLLCDAPCGVRGGGTCEADRAPSQVRGRDEQPVCRCACARVERARSQRCTHALALVDAALPGEEAQGSTL